VLDGASELAASPMEQHTLVHFAELKKLAHLLRRPVLDITQDNDPALVLG
jgi:hypothetical protein